MKIKQNQLRAEYENAAKIAAAEAEAKAAIEKANAASGKQLKLAEETQPISGGFILKDKNVEVNCTFDTLVRLQKAETAGAVVKKLFP